MALSEEPEVYITFHSSFKRKFYFMCTGKKADFSPNSGMTVDFVISLYVTVLTYP